MEFRICAADRFPLRSYPYMKARSGLARIPTLALQQRRRGLVALLPPLEEILRGSLIQRSPTCGNARCKCARGERHPAAWYLTVTLGPGRTTGMTVAPAQVAQVRGWIGNYHRLKEHLEKISDINRELLRRERRRLRQTSGRPRS